MKRHYSAVKNEDKKEESSHVKNNGISSSQKEEYKNFRFKSNNDHVAKNISQALSMIKECRQEVEEKDQHEKNNMNQKMEELEQKILQIRKLYENEKNESDEAKNREKHLDYRISVYRELLSQFEQHQINEYSIRPKNEEETNENEIHQTIFNNLNEPLNAEINKFNEESLEFKPEKKFDKSLLTMNNNNISPYNSGSNLFVEIVEELTWLQKISASKPDIKIFLKKYIDKFFNPAEILLSETKNKEKVQKLKDIIVNMFVPKSDEEKKYYFSQLTKILGNKRRVAQKEEFKSCSLDRVAVGIESNKGNRYYYLENSNNKWNPFSDKCCKAPLKCDKTSSSSLGISGVSYCPKFGIPNNYSSSNYVVILEISEKYGKLIHKMMLKDGLIENVYRESLSNV